MLIVILQQQQQQQKQQWQQQQRERQHTTYGSKYYPTKYDRESKDATKYELEFSKIETRARANI